MSFRPSGCNLQGLVAWLRCRPVLVTFVISLLLSLLAWSGSLINRDGILYVEAARIFLEGGFSAALANFYWPFFPIAFASLAQLTGLGLEQAGYLLNALFMGGVCALLVDIARRRFPEAVWFVALVVLALPGLNEYRNELLREYGAWFFSVLALWLAVRFDKNPGWLSAQLILPSLLLAALFRPEAMAFYLAIVLWQAFASPAGERLRRVLMIAGPACAIAAVFLVYFFNSPLYEKSRLSSDMVRFGWRELELKVAAVSAVLPAYASEQVRGILIWGSVAIIPERFLAKLGVFLLPLLFLAFAGRLGDALKRNSLLSYAFAAHVLVLSIFVVGMQFLAGRYLALLYLFAAPVIGYGIWRFVGDRPRWKIPLLVLLAVLMFTNVVSTGPAKQHFVEAGNWLAANVQDTPRVYIDSGRTLYYSGWRPMRRWYTDDREELTGLLKAGRYDFLVLEVSRKDKGFEQWLADNELQIVQRFSHPNGDAVFIVRTPGAESSAQAR